MLLFENILLDVVPYSGLIDHDPLIYGHSPSKQESISRRRLIYHFLFLGVPLRLIWGPNTALSNETDQIPIPWGVLDAFV